MLSLGIARYSYWPRSICVSSIHLLSYHPFPLFHKKIKCPGPTYYYLLEIRTQDGQEHYQFSFLVSSLLAH